MYNAEKLERNNTDGRISPSIWMIVFAMVRFVKYEEIYLAHLDEGMK